MPRPLWSGSISFGLVHVPVRMFSAVREHKLHFHLVHEKDSSPIGYQKVCKAEGKPVPDDEVVKAFEHRRGEYVFMNDEDFENAQVEGYKSIDVTDFVPAEEIDPIFFAKTYYLGPGNGAEKVYFQGLQCGEFRSKRAGGCKPDSKNPEVNLVLQLSTKAEAKGPQ